MKVLMLVNGLGLGNSTRCHAVLTHLVSLGAEVTVMTSGNGLWYFADRPEISELHELESMYYGSKDGKLSVWGTVAAAGALAGIAMRNDRRIGEVVDRLQPDVVVIDSVYSICALKRRKVPLVALNNSDVVHVAYNLFEDRPSSVRAQFHVVEENDFRFHRMIADRVISPTLDPDLPGVGGPFVRIPPIVRPGCTPNPRTGPPRRVLVMLSGSIFGTPVRMKTPPPGIHVDVVGREAPKGPPTERVTYHGKVLDNRELVSGADLAVVNGGFSAVSELFSMRTPLVVVPVPNHAEQWVNARTITHLGVGAIGTEEELETHLRDALDHLDEYRAAYARLPDPGDGALRGAEAILELARR